MDYSKLVVISEQNVIEHCYHLVEPHLPEHKLIILKPGEEHKNLESCNEIWSKMTEFQCDRHCLVINLGGGVIGDMGGFAAATYKRGVRFFNLPTTILAQVDASVGGKLGIDFNGLKNHIGLFKEPEIVALYTPFINSLPADEQLSGYAEVVKHALIRDANEWNRLRSSDFGDLLLSDTIAHSVKIKKQVIEEDPYEKGVRKILNFGHTVGHAIETKSIVEGKRLLHGFGVAYGIIAESHISLKYGKLTEHEFKDIHRFIGNMYGTPEFPASWKSDIRKLMNQDKKNKKGKVMFSILENIGTCIFDAQVEEHDIDQALDLICMP